MIQGYGPSQRRCAPGEPMRPDETLEAYRTGQRFMHATEHTKAKEILRTTLDPKARRYAHFATEDKYLRMHDTILVLKPEN